jgi:hypothetical protein
MDFASQEQVGDGLAERLEDKRADPRYVSLIRAAKLILPQGEFVCVIRDVSRSGIGIKLFHALPRSTSEYVLELQNGDRHQLDLVRKDQGSASFTFSRPVPVGKLIKEEWQYPRRQLRLNIAIPVELATVRERHRATVVNLSQQGARVECDALFAINQRITLSGQALKDIRTAVRWRRDGEYGLVLDDTFTLPAFALLAARLQCPALLHTPISA